MLWCQGEHESTQQPRLIREPLGGFLGRARDVFTCGLVIGMEREQRVKSNKHIAYERMMRARTMSKTCGA